MHVEGGVATPNTVTFTYKTPDVPDVPADVTVVYQYDRRRKDRPATTQSLGSGDHTITPTSELVAGLELDQRAGSTGARGRRGSDPEHCDLHVQDA